MTKTIVVGLLAAAGAFAGVLVNGSRLNAADEIRCRVNVEALFQDITAMKQGKPDIDREFIKQLLQPKKP